MMIWEISRNRRAAREVEVVPETGQASMPTRYWQLPTEEFSRRNFVPRWALGEALEPRMLFYFPADGPWDFSATRKRLKAGAVVTYPVSRENWRCLWVWR